jgi:hypothetical protein
VISQPSDKLVEAELVGFVQRGDEIVGLLGVGGETHAVDGETRKVYMAAKAVRLLPSMKAWFS